MDEDEFIFGYDNDNPYYAIHDYARRNGYGKYKRPVIRSEDAVLETYTNWNSPQADKERTIFGDKEADLFYNYSDRLAQWDYDKDRRANEYAALVAQPKTAKYFTAMLSYFHDGAEVSLRHIVAGCNRSNGFPYLVYGYKYTTKPEDAGRLAEYDKIRLGRTAALEQAKTEFTAKFDEAMADVLKNTNSA